MTRPLTLCLGAAAALGVIHTAAWFWAEGRIESELAKWSDARRADGWAVSSAPPARGGWPLTARLDLVDVAVTGGAGAIPGGVTWRDGRVALSVSFLHPGELRIVPNGVQTLRIGALPDIAIAGGSIALTVPLEIGQPAHSADFRATQLRVGPADGPTDGPALTLALAQAHVEEHPNAAKGEAAFGLAGSAQDIGLPPPPPGMGTSWPLGPRIASLSLEGDLTGPVSRAPDPRLRATAWRDGGGALEIRRFAAGWGPLGLSMSGALGLDDRLQPAGEGAARLIGQNEAIDALASAHVITVNAATAAKAVLGMIARPPENGGSPEAEVRLDVQNHVLSVGRIPLIKLPVLTWSGGA